MTHLFIDEQTSRLCGFHYVLSELKPISPYGVAAKQAMQPFLPGFETALVGLFALQTQLLHALQADATPFNRLEHQLAQLPDWRGALSRLEAGAILTDVDFLGLKQLLYWHTAIKEGLQQLPLPQDLSALNADFSKLMSLLDPEQTGSPTFYLADSYSPQLAALRQEMRLLRQTLHQYSTQQDQALAQQLGQSQLPTGEFRAPKGDSQLCQLLSQRPELTVSRTTPTDIYYKRQPDQQELAWQQELARLQAEIKTVEDGVRAQLSHEIRQYGPSLRALLQTIGHLDLLLARVRLAHRWQCLPPKVLTRSAEEKACIDVEGARHPQVAAQLAEQGHLFQPISWRLASGATVLTGANMGGKTVALRLMALLTAMAQYGLMVPAQEFTFTLVEGIRLVTTSYSADTPGLSRFGSEVKALKEALALIGRNFLLLYDEPASGTNPVEGAALAQALVEYTAHLPSINAFATHYAELAHLQGVAHWQVVGLSRTDPERLVQALTSSNGKYMDALTALMDYGLQPVPPGQPLPQEALSIAHLLGLPASIIDRAKELIGE